MAQLTQTSSEQLIDRDEAGARRRRGTFWTALATVEVLLAAVAVVLDLLIPTIVILALAGTSLALRREELGTLGLRRAPHPGRMAAVVFGLVVGWQLLTLGLVKPILNHLTGITEDLSQFADLQGNLGLLAGLLLVTWTLAAFGEELDHERVLFAAGTETESVQVTTAELFWDEPLAILPLTRRDEPASQEPVTPAP